MRRLQHSGTQRHRAVPVGCGEKSGCVARDRFQLPAGFHDSPRGALSHFKLYSVSDDLWVSDDFSRNLPLGTAGRPGTRRTERLYGGTGGGTEG